MASADAIGALEERLRDAPRQDLDAIVDTYETKVGPRNGARVVVINPLGM